MDNNFKKYIKPKGEHKKNERRVIFMAKIDIPVYEKPNLTVEEAAIYFSIGENKLRELTDRSDCNFVLFVGRKRLIKRKQFESFLDAAYSI